MKYLRTSLLCIFLISIIIMTGCSADKNPINTWGISYSEYNCPVDFPDTETTVRIANDILSGQLIVNYVDDNYLTYDVERLDTFDWDIQHGNSPNTFQLYLQCLNPIAYLCKAYEINGEEKYLTLADAFFESWIEYKSTLSSTDNSNPFLWYDHGTALRAENIIYYALIKEKANQVDESFADTITELLIEHGERLANPDYYTSNHNHGIFQDRALIYISYFVDCPTSEEWLQLAKERLTEQHNYAFNSENAHVENSPGYQFGVMELFLDIGNFLKQYDDDFGVNLCANIVESAEFMSWMIKPNGTTAEIGDTNSIADYESAHANDLSQYQNDHLIYSSSLGADGTKPENHSAIYPQTGYYFGRTSWEHTNYSDATWCMFKSGYSSKTHKHADDCSFMLYSRGYDIFVDPGWYNYVTGTKQRDYFVSSGAHNTVIVDGNTYSPTVENSSKTGIFDYNLSSDYDYVLGINDMYTGVNIDRHFYRAGDVIVLYDDIVSDDTHIYSQLFHLSEVMQIESSSDEEVLLAIGNTGCHVRIRQVGTSAPFLNVIEGQDDTTYGHISRGMNLLDEIITLKYDLYGSDVSYVTIITIEDAEGMVMADDSASTFIDYQNIYFDQDTHMLWIGDNNILLSARERFYADQVQLETDGDQITATNIMSAENLSFAWYVMDRNSAEVIEKTEYSPQKTFVYKVPEGDYLLKAYVKSSEGIRKSAIVAHFTNENGLVMIDNANPDLWNLNRQGQDVTDIGNNNYRFDVHFDYLWSYRIKWYIYKNGGYYDLVSTTEPYLNYTFNESGNFTVMYYLSTANGDNEFWNFSQIVIP